MTSTHGLHHMYIDAAPRFRDPFVVSKGLTPPSKSSPHDHDRSTATWTNHPRYPDYPRSLTPPPEMSGAQTSAAPAYHQKQHGHHYGDYLPAASALRAPIAPYLPQEVSNASFGRNAATTRQPSRASPIPHAPIESTSDAHTQRQAPGVNAIANHFQIPRSVNDSGGSLSELAAQITCLFWFESSEILQQVEDSSIPLQSPRALSADAKPTTGFRKWVTTILSTTMVAQNVVILALLFIYRLKKLNPTVQGKPGSEYRLLTVALMLGNKFLDDNTYTNKTWAEVSGINVGEVHIMEVEFLSNMKYCLYTSEQDWARWQSLLGKFAAFFDRASRPQPPPPVLPPASSLHLPVALPSPPSSNQASPPYVGDMAHHGAVYNAASQLGPTPAPSPLGTGLDPTGTSASQPASRKRSHDDHAIEPPAKRLVSGYQGQTSPQRYSSIPVAQSMPAQAPRLNLPGLSIPPSTHGSSATLLLPTTEGQQLPPLSVPSRAMAMVYPTSTSQGYVSQSTAATVPPMQPSLQYGSRHQSPYGDGLGTSPSSAVPSSATALRPTNQVSPTYFLQQRTSPYRPVHHVSTLLYPPPSTAMQNRPPTVELSQMQYQPLGKPVQHNGRLPYVAQNLWLDGNQPQEMTPIHQWPGFASGPHQPQHSHLSTR